MEPRDPLNNIKAISRLRYARDDKEKMFFINLHSFKIKMKQNTNAPKKRNNLFLIIPLLFLFIILYFLIQESGSLEILSRLNEQNLSYSLIFLIGILASFHCVGMCGGLVVTYTATGQKKKNCKECKNNYTPHWQYNLGRLISYTFIGGVLGGFGSFFGINPTFTGIITLLASIFMVLMGLSLLTGFKWLKKVQLSMPKFIGKYLYNNSDNKKPKGPFIIGLLNGFMPCGPLQAMQLYALTTGSITRGALSMAIYALGTIPLMFGFGSFISTISKSKIGQIMKISGLVVIILGLFMFNRGLTNFGLGFKNFIRSNQVSETEFKVAGNIEEYQVINMNLTLQGYEPNILYIKAGIPVRWVINVKQMSGCTNSIILHGYDIEKDLKEGENIIEFIPKETGEIKFSCWMQMVWGKFIVTEGDVSPNQSQVELESESLPEESCDCGIIESN
jgi:sulfite exporter TauE/SafE